MVSGQRERSIDITSVSPVTVIDGDTIAASGAASLDQVLNKLPIFGFQGVNGSQNDGGYGAAFLDLRNLNFNRTLVLVNGRRFVLSGIKTDEAVDMNNIPLALIDHVEVLRDGSEPKYGADAIAGAVNIVLKKDFEGVAASAMGGVSGHGDGATDQISATFGHNFGQAGNVTFSASQSHSNPIRQSDRSWARDPITSAETTSDGSVQLARGETATPSGHAVSTGGIDAVMLRGGQYRDFNAATDSYDFSQARYLQAGQDRKTATLLAHGELAETVSAFTELSYVLRNSGTLEPPTTLGLAGTAKYPSGFVVPANNSYNPFGEDVTLQRVLSELGNQLTQTEATTARAVFGLEGLVAGGNWSVSVNHGETHQTYSTSGAVNLSKVFNTLSDDPTVCAAAVGCVEANYFGNDSLSPAAANYIGYTDIAHSAYRENALQASFGHPVVSLPGGLWTATLGGEYRTEFGSTNPDPVTAAGDQAASDQAATGGGYRSREIYLDTSLPLLKDQTMAKSVVVDASIRYSSYDRFGEFPTWKTALSWAPISDIRFRGTVGAGRRVPAITEAYGGSTASFLAVQDPCDSVSGALSNPVVAANCRKLGLSSQFTQASSLLNVSNGGNPNLTPESSENFTVGAVVTPRWLKDLTISADYYNIRVKNAIDALSDADPNFIPDQCYASVNMSSPYCALITRVPSGPSAGQISKILSPDENIGAIHTDGIDVGLAYGIGLGDVGRLSFDWQNTFLINYLVQETPGSPFVQYAGTFPGLVDSGAYSRYRSSLSTRFETESWIYDWTTRYIDGAKVQGQDVALYSKAPGVFYHDVEASWRLKPLTVRFGVDNVFDQKPPTLMDGQSNTDLNTYDVVGRFFFVSTSVVF
ncbi:TonB-dependent receptor domain-containing protein [Telmatospirillum sp.]|uniref:TonB-dependent receptor domain-containing protein n=1 Tax=Telmatospirillum sp. TaxID=2079197 RepID=UPI00284D11C8|nr:TonB-dependent receptor [Telmatospirillum sp.]MDR3438297.1 TonB-dependent receptor [Telmatospirillum sp.]